MENLIECKYGKHMCSSDEFTPSGLNNECYKICRKCNVEKVRKSRQKHRNIIVYGRKITELN
jgi:hypothetical protein